MAWQGRRQWGISATRGVPHSLLQVQDGWPGGNTIAFAGVGMIINRDRVLTKEVVRGCWHEWPKEPSSRLQSRSDLCLKCGGIRGGVFYIDFSTWHGFGELWDQLKQRKYWGEFLAWLTQKYSWAEWEVKTPSQRADVVFEFLHEFLAR